MKKLKSTGAHRGADSVIAYICSHQNMAATFLLGACAFFVTVQYLCILPPLICNGAQLLIGICSLLLCFLTVGIGKLRRCLIFGGIYTVFGIISFLYNGNADAIELLWPLGYMSAGLLLVFFRPNTRVCQALFYGYCAVILLTVTLAGDVDAAHFNASRNMISVHVLVFLSIYLISVRKSGERFSVLPFLSAIFLCLVARGRSGIVLAGIFALYLLICLVFDRRSMCFCGKLDLLFCTAMVLIYCYPVLKAIKLPEVVPPTQQEANMPNTPSAEPSEEPPEEPSEEPSEEPPHLENTVGQGIKNFQARGLRTGRFNIWGDYLKKACSSFMNILLGASINGTPMLDEFSTNLHNSFLMLHAKYGLLGLLLVLLAMACSGWRYLIQRNIHYLFLMAALFWRMNLDYTNFNGILDLLLIFLIFYPAMNQKAQVGKERPLEKAV